MNALDCLSYRVGSIRQLCCNKILLLSSPRCLDMIAGLICFQRRSQLEALVTVVSLFVYCSTSGTWWFEYSVVIIFSADVDVCIILGALMSLNSGIICLSALFQAGSSGPSCHTHCVFPSVQEWLSRHLPCRHLTDLQHFVDHKVSWTMTDIQHGSHFMHLDTEVHVDGTFSIHSCLQCYNSVALAQMSHICDNGHHILKIPTTFVHLLQR
jgi:hypothetical protein